MPNVTVKDIARRARVSIGTVDRVLHKRGRAAKSTIVKVMKAAKEMDYQPNIFARNLSLAKKLRFGVVMPRSAQNGGYWKLADRGLLDAGKEFAPFSVSTAAFRYDRYSRTSFEKAMRSAAEECPDGLLAAVVDPSAGIPLLTDIMSRIPVVLFDSYIPDVSPIAFIGQDSYQSGVLSGKLMSLAAGDGEIVAVQPVADDHHISDRIRGFADRMGGPSRIIVEPLDGNAEDDAAVKALFLRHPDAKGFFVASADVHRFATYAAAAGGKRERTFIGYDLTEVNRMHVETGMIDFIIDQKPDVQVRNGLTLLYRSVALKTPPEADRMLMPLDIITKENVRYYRA
ncbi:MAG: LacI family DNA-binding transcriptional regulator [Spirochaetota bacterium]